VFAVDTELYDRHVRDAVLFLEGRGDELVNRLKEQMYEASEDMEFERAASYRDQILSVSKALDRQSSVSVEIIDRDVFGYHREGDRLTVQVMYVRGGKLEGVKAFSYKGQEFPDQELMSSFLNLYYASGSFVPKEVLVPIAFDEEEFSAFEELLADMKGQKVAVYSPQRGAKKLLVDTANENARVSFEKEHDKDERTQDLLENLQNRLGLRNYPERIECYDISNLQGKQIVASMVVFEDGIPNKAEYRRYKMKEVTSQDDFASMREVLSRRFAKVADGTSGAPSLVVVDGGKGQLGQAFTVLEDLGLHEIDLISLAKSRVDKVGFEDEEITRSAERVFLPGRKNPVVLKQNSAELYLLERIRDEAHRFAITFHKELRRKASMKSVLDDIPGIGAKTRKDLLKHFGSLKKIRDASLEELEAAPGIGPKTAIAIHEFLND